MSAQSEATVSGSIGEAHQALERVLTTRRLRERDILECQTEQELRVWLSWAVDGLVPAAAGARVGLTATQTRAVLERAQEKLRQFITGDRLHWAGR